jgi:hypothetical protein
MDACMSRMMDMQGMGWMVGAAAVVWLLVIVLLVLGIAALWKYLRR